MVYGNMQKATISGALGAALAFLAACAVLEGEYNQLVLCDRSSSGAELACGALVLGNAAHAWYGQARLRGAGRFEILLIGGGIDDTPVLFRRDYPAKFPAPVSRSQEQWREAFLAAVDSLAGALPSNRGSAIVEGMFRASHRLADRPTTVNALLIASDMRQYTPGQWNFEREVPDYEQFLAWIEESELAPRYGVLDEIVVCGFHMASPGGTTRMTAANYARLEALWERILARWAPRAGVREECGEA